MKKCVLFFLGYFWMALVRACVAAPPMSSLSSSGVALLLRRELSAVPLTAQRSLLSEEEGQMWRAKEGAFLG